MLSPVQQLEEGGHRPPYLLVIIGRPQPALQRCLSVCLYACMSGTIPYCSLLQSVLYCRRRRFAVFSLRYGSVVVTIQQKSTNHTRWPSTSNDSCLVSLLSLNKINNSSQIYMLTYSTISGTTRKSMMPSSDTPLAGKTYEV